MIACVCPGSTSADHTLNTLRYADRLKDRGDAGKAKIGKNDFEINMDLQQDFLDYEPQKGKNETPINNNNKPPTQENIIPTKAVAENKNVPILQNNNNNVNNQNAGINNPLNQNQQNLNKKNVKASNQQEKERPMTENKMQNNNNNKNKNNAQGKNVEEFKVNKNEKKKFLILYLFHELIYPVKKVPYL